MRTIWMSFAFLLASVPVEAAPKAHQPNLSAAAVNNAGFSTQAFKSTKEHPILLKAQILLDRARISGGVIDAKIGENLEKAVAQFQQQKGLALSGKLDEATWSSLTQTSNEPVLVGYQITPGDVKGPFTKNIPAKFEQMAKLPKLNYRNARERLAEKFHISEELLAKLNSGKGFDRVGVTILVPNLNGKAASERVAKIEIDKTAKTLKAYGQEGQLIAFYPATIGDEDTPSPSGTVSVRQIVKDPTYVYDPKKLDFKEIKTKKKLTIRPGPNNPVGVIWIEITSDGYGIHGTPAPSKVAKSFSHGCVRLTNWDVVDLASRIQKGVPVTFLN